MGQAIGNRIGGGKHSEEIGEGCGISLDAAKRLALGIVALAQIDVGPSLDIGDGREDGQIRVGIELDGLNDVHGGLLESGKEDAGIFLTAAVGRLRSTPTT